MYRKHVFGDLQPYICLFPFCSTQDHKYSRRSDWAHHMNQVHWRSWRCPYECQQGFENVDVFRCHLREKHPDDLTSHQQDTLEKMCSHEDPKKALGLCPLCLIVEISSAKQYRDHIGHHLKQLALFALPQTAIDDNESTSRINFKEVEDVPQAPQDQSSSTNISINDSSLGDLPELSIEEKGRDLEAFRRLPILTGQRQSGRDKWRWDCVSHSSSHGVFISLLLSTNRPGSSQIVTSVNLATYMIRLAPAVSIHEVPVAMSTELSKYGIWQSWRFILF